ncbi:hypothetical protein EBZ37_15190, partial [bacterium]|nr:hypothetical protein [bacterium]
QISGLESEVAKQAEHAQDLNRALEEAQNTIGSLQSELRSARFGNEKLQDALRKARMAESELSHAQQEEKAALNDLLAARDEELFRSSESQRFLETRVGDLEESLRRRVVAEEEVIAVIESRLKKVLQEKDESIAELTGEVELWREKYNQIEYVLNQQRLEMLAHLP